MKKPAPALDPKLFQLMAESVQDYAIFMLDPGGHIMSWNPGAERAKQYEAHEIIGKHFSIFYTPADIERKWPQFELQRATMDGRFEDEGWRLRKDGSRFWAHVVITALRDESGKLLAFSKITRDLSERRRQEDELRRSEERFRLLVEGVQDYAIYMLTPDGTVTSWNGGARRIKGYEAHEIVGKHFSRFYRAEDIDAGKPWGELAMAREHGRAEDEGWRVRKDGTRFWARVVVTALRDADGQLHGYAKVTQDLTQQRQSAALEVATRQVHDFIAVLAHELRNPLAPIRNAAHLLAVATPGAEEFEVARGAIDRQSAQLMRIVDDLLDIGRITRGAFSIHPQRVDLRDIAARAVEAARPGIDSAGHQLSIDLPPEPVFLQADELRVTQALTNVLNNAARYTDPGGKISLALRRESPDKNYNEDPDQLAWCALSVRDTGRGIEPEFMGSIFGMFVQGRPAASRSQSGLGVGLALARAIIELHHGTIEAQSAGAGKGSEFIIRLPVEAGTPAAAVEQPKRPANGLPGRPRRVLVVDDNVDAATMLAALIRQLGHEVQIVHDGSAALEAAEGYRPEVILLDIGMPGMNGFEVARRLRELRRIPAVRIVAVTGWGKPEDRKRSREAGFDMHLMKPVELSEIQRALLLNGASSTKH
ncbi:MAG TPA: PAS domain S-box protein [Burkholderiales bacterium]|nr:PAS domain S-box protein [Burkholderiales bacterium]